MSLTPGLKATNLRFPDAIDSYENLLMHGAQHLDFMTGFNLILCYFALGDKDKMKSGFLKLLNIEQAQIHVKGLVLAQDGLNLAKTIQNPK